MSSGRGYNQSGLKKMYKKDPIKSLVLRVPPHLVGAIFVYGRINSGKTTSILSLGGLYHDNPQRKYKVFDLWGGDRNEHLYWTLPSDQIAYWNGAKKMLRLDKPGPKQYKVNLWYPLTKKLPKKLPFFPNYVTSKLFTIPIRNFTSADASLVIGSIPESVSSLWNNVVSDSSSNDNVFEVLEEFSKTVQKRNSFYNSILIPLSKDLLFQNDACLFNLTNKIMAKELDDQETISILCLDFVDKEYKLFVIGYFMRLISEELDKKRRQTIGIIREASEFFNVTDKSVVPDRYKVMKRYLSTWIKMGRRGFHLLLDTQSPHETRGIVDGQQDLTLFGRLPSEGDRTAATERLFKDGFITQKQITKLASSMPGEFCFCPSGRPVEFNYVMLPKSDFWKEKNGNFYNNVWGKQVDKWTSFSEEIKVLKEKYNEEKKEMEVKKFIVSKKTVNKPVAIVKPKIETEIKQEEVPQTIVEPIKEEVKKEEKKLEPIVNPWSDII
tara:strand:- start:4223 stop:5707 length:1485 start_codon:yes stop_codon:yes gene_type:complete